MPRPKKSGTGQSTTSTHGAPAPKKQKDKEEMSDGDETTLGKAEAHTPSSTKTILVSTEGLGGEEDVGASAATDGGAAGEGKPSTEQAYASFSDIPPLLGDLARECGVYTDYIDQQGNRVMIPADTVSAMLRALGHDVHNDEAIERSLENVRLRDWRRKVPPVVVVRQSLESRMWVHIPPGDEVRVWVELEASGMCDAAVSTKPFSDSDPHQIALHETGEEAGDQEVSGRNVDGVAKIELLYRIPAHLPLGWHRIIAEHAGERSQTALVVTPFALNPRDVIGDRLWGFMAQVYATRSTKSWGLGDLRDCRMLAEWSAKEWGAGFVLINPLHAAAPVRPITNSPYSPVTRRFSNPIYLHIEDIPEMARIDEGGKQKILELERKMQARNKTPDLLDRDSVWAAKAEALELLYVVPLTEDREAEFEAYCRREGAGLRDFATWCAISEEHGPLISSWPEGLKYPHNPEVDTFRERKSERVRFHSWIQWQLEDQLEALQHAARAAAMPIGIVHDLAVSVHSQGADAWGLEHVFIRGVSLGSPPDNFNQMGQDWSIPPWHPQALKDAAYIPFRDMLRTILRAAGGIRIDHAFGLFRLWCVPEGFPASQGTYITIDHEALIGIMCLEAHRAGALLIAEDVGTGLPIVPQVLHERGILGTNIMLCEEQIKPAEWRQETLLSVTVHDLPPTAGYLRNEHVRIRHEVGLLVRPVEEEQANANKRLAIWEQNLKEQGLLEESADVSTDKGLADMALALYKAAGVSEARLIGISLTDVLGDKRTQNQPGTDKEYPNWCVPMGDAQGNTVVLEDIMASDEHVRKFVEAVQLPVLGRHDSHGAASSAGAGRAGSSVVARDRAEDEARRGKLLKQVHHYDPSGLPASVSDVVGGL